MKKIATLILVCVTAACSGNKSSGPTSLSSIDQRTTRSESFGVIQSQIPSTTASVFSACLAGSGGGPCFSGASLRARTVGNSAAISAPPNLVASANGSDVTLTWTAVSGAVAYIIEAGSASGLANLANFSTGNPQTTFSANGVGAGAYFVRVRAVGTAGDLSASSNEVLLVVAGSGPCVQPGPPSGLSVVSVSLGTVVLTWSAAAGNPSSYVVEAGSSPGLSNLANSDLGLTTSLTATGVGPGTYYVRIRAKSACGISGAPSNEVVLTVGAGTPSPTPTPTPTPTPGGSFGAGQYLIGRDIPAGRYFSDPSYGCYWERQSGLGGRLADILSNEFVGFDAAQWIVDILSSDLAFKTERSCGSWFNTPMQGPQANIRPGVWLVGAQLAPGTYRTAAQYGCYWERSRNFTGNLSAIIANEFVSSAGQQLVSISSGDAGFYATADCGTWTRVSGITAELTSQSYDDIEVKSNRHRSMRGLPGRIK